MIVMEEQVPNVEFLLRTWEVPDSITGSYSDSPKVLLYWYVLTMRPVQRALKSTRNVFCTVDLRNLH
jgi:hypothetical protein